MSNRHARINVFWLLLLAGGGAVGLLVLLLGVTMWRPDDDGVSTLQMHCAAGLRVPVTEIAEQYEKETGVHVELQFGGSNTLLNQLEVTKDNSRADLFLTADDFYTDEAVKRGLATEVLPLTLQRPVIAVAKGNPKGIKSIEDLLREDVAVALASPDQAAVGRAVKKRLEKAGRDLWPRLEKHAKVTKPTVNDVANDVKLGEVDAAILWDSTVAMPGYADHLEAINVPELDGDPDLVSVCVLNSGTDPPTAALRFARYLAARDKGLPVFAKYGTRPVEGDAWAGGHPQVNFSCGAVNRRAVEKIVDEFEKREGVTINDKYNGCGILTGEMKTIDEQDPDKGFPDVYMACDIYYMENVQEWFEQRENVSDVEMVIAVPKGNPRGVQSLEDLVKPGVRVTVGRPDSCTIGALTRRMLEREGLYDRLMEKQQTSGEVVEEKVSSALLVPDVTTGHADATVCYISDVLPNRDKVDFVRIDSPHNLAIQPFGIAKTSRHKYLMRRLFNKIAASPEAFEKAGFHFRLKEKIAAPSPAVDPAAE